MSVSHNVSFINFCQLCTKISEASHEKKASLLQQYIDGWKKKANELKKTHSNINDSFYPVLRLLLPQLDRQRGAYGVKEHTLAKIYIRILSLPKDGDAAKFLEFRKPKSGSSTGDFAELAYWILKKRCVEGGQLSIADVSDHLDAIAAKHAANEPRGVDTQLISLLKATSAEEQKWLIRIILKDMKLGIGQNSILKCYHPDAKDLYETCNNLKKVSDVLKDPEIRLNEVQIELFSPVKPMLSEECDFQKLDAYLKRSRFFYIESKLDGERFQLHKNEGDYKYFSRNGFDYTSNFGATRFEGVLTSKIADRFHSDVRSCILDGEMMSWNTETANFLNKGENIDVKTLKENNIYQPCFCVFDVLFYNGQVLTNQPLHFRIEILNKIFSPLTGAICFVTRKRISSKEEVVDSLNEAIDNREEGIVMKEFMSVYKPNIRNNGGWYKIKPEYIDGLADTLDLLILGGYFGSGRHNGSISHFLLGVAASAEDDSKLFYSVAKVGSGYSLSELEELLGKIKGNWKPVKIEEMPPEIIWAKERPDVWIPPDKSFVLEIKASEITRSNFFKTGYTLRFPRVKRVRYDKSWKDCLTFEEFEEKRKKACGKLTSQHFTSNVDQGPQPKKKCQRSNVAVGHQYKAVDITEVQCISNLLSGKEICVFTGFGNVKKEDVERKIVEFGGNLVQNPGKKTLCILAETDSTTRIKNIIKSDLYDLVKTSWFYSQLNLENNYFPPFKPQNFLSATSKTSKILAKSYDEFGDHFTSPITRDSIPHLMEATSKYSENMVLSVDDKHAMDMELFSEPSPYSLFRMCCAYFDRFSVLENSSSGYLPYLEVFEMDFKFFGGQSSECIKDETTHVVVFSGDLSRLKEINAKNDQRLKKFSVVTEKWISNSLKSCSFLKLISSDGFFLRFSFNDYQVDNKLILYEEWLLMSRGIQMIFDQPPLPRES